MATKETRRKIDAYVMHAHVGTTPLDNYQRLFRDIEQMEASERRLVQGDRQTSLPNISIGGDRVRLVAYEGDTGVNPLIFNIEQGSERHTRLRENEILATRTQAVLDCRTRKVVVEYNQRGAKASDFTAMIAAFGRRALSTEDFTFDLAPLPGQSFLEELRKFGRVQLANVKLTRPNHDWNDAEDALSGVAQDSQARMFEVTLTAQRRGSLSLRHGILAAIRQMVSRSHPNVKDVRVRGFHEGSSAQTDLSLQKHFQHKRVEVRRGADGYPRPDDISHHLEVYLDELIAAPEKND